MQNNHFILQYKVDLSQSMYIYAIFCKTKKVNICKNIIYFQIYVLAKLRFCGKTRNDKSTLQYYQGL